MPVWNVAYVSDVPQIRLVRWRIYETDLGARHFVGWSVTGREGRVSTAITTFDEKALRGVTESGRVYELEGPPGHDEDAEYVWQTWLRALGVESYRDVTSDASPKTRTAH